MKLLFKFSLGFSFLILAQPVVAGQVKQIADSLGCIKTIAADDRNGTGISTGKLSEQILVRQCNGQSKLIDLKNGKLRTAKPSKAILDKFATNESAAKIPHSLYSTGTGKITSAWLTQPTRRYGHAVLGDSIEAGGFAIQLSDKTTLEYTLNSDSVYEDLQVRLTDLTGDGKQEIVLVRAFLERGAAIAIYAVHNQKIVELAQSQAIGTPNRWLNPAAAADFDGDGKVELAWVETPHIGGTLKVARLTGAGEKHQLKTIDQLPGFSNHKIGSRQLMMSVTFDWNGDGISDIILPDAGRRSLLVVSMASGKLKIIDRMKIAGEISSPLIAADLDGNGTGEVLLTTKDGRLLSFSP